MKYDVIQREYTNEKIPKAWQNAVVMQKTAEILVYQMLTRCMESFDDIEIILDANDPIAKTLVSWTLDKKVGFGTNALSVTTTQDEKVVFGCRYDIYKLSDDLEMIASDMFGTINSDACGEKVLDSDDLDLPDEKIDSLHAGIQKKLVPIADKK